MKAPQSRMTERYKAVLAQRREGAKENQRKIFAPLRLCASIFLCGLILITGCNSNDTTKSKTPVISGAPSGTTYPMPPANGASIATMGWESEGKRSVFAEYKGKVLVLDFYATWCAPCRDSVPHLVGLQKKYEDKGLVVVGLNVGGPGDDQEVPAFAKEYGIQYALAMPDEDLVTFLLADEDAIPQTFVFDRQGRLVERFIGFGSETGKHIDAAVETGLQTQAP